MLDYDEALDILEHPRRYPRELARAAQRAAAGMLSQHALSAQQAADALGLSKPTVLAWIDAGILPEAPGSRDTRRLLDPLAVYAARSALDEVHLEGSISERAERMRELLADVYWATHPTLVDRIEQSRAAIARGEGVPASELIAKIEASHASHPEGKADR